jgi:hypothetical protein
MKVDKTHTHTYIYTRSATSIKYPLPNPPNHIHSHTHIHTHTGEKAAEASGDLLKGFIYGKMAAQEQEVKHEQAHRLLLQRGARGAAHIEIEGAHTDTHTHGEGMLEGSVHGSPLGGVAKGGMHKMR